jgi:hypothetical protein
LREIERIECRRQFLRVSGIHKRLISLALVFAALIAVALSQAASFPWTKNVVETAYFEGRTVEYSPARAHWGEKMFRLGPWDLGPKLTSQEKDDKRPNLYVVVPGTARVNPSAPEYNHNLVLSGLPKTDDLSDFDVYWALILDPNVKEDIRAETQLLLAAQEPFTPGADFQFASIPSHAFLDSYLHINSLEQLSAFQRPDGSLPKVAIIPAKLAVRAKITEPETQSQETVQAPSDAH